MGAGSGNGPGLATMQVDSTGWQLGRKPGRPTRAMHVGGVVAGWKVDVFRRSGGRQSPPVASAFSGWTSGADYVRPNRGGWLNRGAGRVVDHFDRPAGKCNLDSRWSRGSPAVFRRARGAFGRISLPDYQS